MTSWLESYANVHLKPSTAEGYRQVCEGHLFSAIGDRLLHTLTRADIKRLIGQLLAKGLRKRTIHNILTPLKEAFHHAMDEQLVASNPVTKLGRFVTAREGASAHIDPLTATEVRRSLDQAKDRFPDFYPLWLCALRTGMRRGELLGLQWGDIDFSGQFTEVRRAVVRRQVTSTKTHKVRRVDMSPQLSSTLKALKETRSLEASLKGTVMPEWVFLTPHGHRMTTEVLQKAFFACLDGAGIRRVRFHDCRHTYASLLIQQGANVKYIQQQLGHGSISITLDIYSHLFQGDHQHQVHRLDDPQENMVNLTGTKAESATQPQPVRMERTDATIEDVDITCESQRGGVTERPNVPVLKTGDLARGPRVQISPPPPYFLPMRAPFFHLSVRTSLCTATVHCFVW